MNPKVTSKEELLTVCKQIVKEEGIEAINIRTLSQKCDIAVGSVYNYFSSKEILVVSVVEAIWNEIFDFKNYDSDKNIVELAEEILDSIDEGKKKYPNFIGVHSLNFNKTNVQGGKNRMDLYFTKIKMILRSSLEETWSDVNGFGKDDFVDILFNLIFSQFLMGIDKKSIIGMIKVIIKEV